MCGEWTSTSTLWNSDTEIKFIDTRYCTMGKNAYYVDKIKFQAISGYFRIKSYNITKIMIFSTI